MEVDVVSITLHELYLSFHFLLLSNIFFYAFIHTQEQKNPHTNDQFIQFLN